MAVKPVIDIDINDEKFTAFIAKWDEYRASLHSMPAEWQAVNKRVGEFQKLQMAAGVDAGVALNAAMKMEGALKKVATVQERGAIATHRTALSFRDIGKHTRELAKHIGGITRDLAKWGALGAIGGGFGLDALGNSAMNQRSGARGMNVSIGQAASMKVNMSRFFNPDGVMQRVNDATHNYADYGYIAAMGLNPTALKQSGSFNSTLTIADRARSQFLKDHKNLNLAQAQGLTQFFSNSELMRMANTPQKSWDKSLNAARTDSHNLGLGQGVTSAWTQFSIQMRRAGTEIENTLIKGLVGLAPELEAISKSAVKFTDAFVKGGGMQKALIEFEGGLSTVAKFFASGKFQADAGKLATATGDAAREIAAIAKTLAPYAKLATEKTKAANGLNAVNKGASDAGKWVHDKATNAWHWVGNELGWEKPKNNPGNIRAPLNGFERYSTQAQGIRAMDKLLQTYPRNRHVDTLASIIPIWNGHGKNDPEYIANVSKWSGIAPDAKINMSDRATRARLIAAMSRMEGSDRVSATQAMAALRAKRPHLAGHPGDSPLEAHFRKIDPWAFAAQRGEAGNHLSKIEKHLRGMASRTTAPKANVTVSAPSGSHVAVSANNVAH
jgi:hypothetical protein